MRASTRSWGCLSILIGAIGTGCGSDDSAQGEGTSVGGGSAADTANPGAGGNKANGGSVAVGGDETAGGFAGFTSGTGDSSSGDREGGAGSGGLGPTGSGGAKGSGGSSGTGGTTGGGGGVDAGAPDAATSHPDAGSPNVLPCNQLGPKDVWQNVTPPVSVLGSPPSGANWSMGGIAVDPANPGTVYAGSTTYPSFHPNGFWRSVDCGAHWTAVATGRNGNMLTQGDPSQITVDPMTGAIYTMSFYGAGHLYKSTNAGVDWDDVSPSGNGMPGFVQGWAMDPDDHLHIVLTFHQNCQAPDTLQCLAETHDGGASWRPFPGPFPNNGWAEGVGVIVASGKILYAAPFGGLYLHTGDTTPWKQLVGSPGCFPTAAQVGSTFYVGCYQSNRIQMTQDFQAWSALANAPSPPQMAVTGKYMYANTGDPSGQPVWRAPLNDLNSWAHVTALQVTLGQPSAASGNFSYDSSHHVLYLSTWSGGFWRVLTD
jgi:hypothetical protein